MKTDMLLELIDKFVPDGQKQDALRWCVCNTCGWGGKRAKAGAPKGNSNAKKKNNQDAENNQVNLIVPEKKIVEASEESKFYAGKQNWEFPKNILAVAKKYWKPETIRNIEIDFCCQEYYTETSIKDLLEQYPSDLSVEFVLPDARFTRPWLEWLEYKKSVRQSYKTASAKKKAWNTMLKLSGGDPAIAQQIVDRSITNGWQGLFPLRNNTKIIKNSENATTLNEWARQ